MAKSAHLRASDVQALLNLVGECRDLGADRVAWRRHLIDGLAALVDAEGGFIGEMAGCGAPETVRDLGVVPWSRDDIRRPWTLGPDEAEVIRDPKNWVATNAYHARNQAGTGLCLARTDVLDDLTWRGLPDHGLIREILGVDHRIWCFCPISGGGPTDQAGLILARNVGRRNFSRRDCLVVGLAHREVAHLVGHRLARFADPSPDDLTPRVRQVLAHLLDGDGDKRIAVRLNLSPHTINEYIKVIFRHFGVRARSELLALWIRRSCKTPNNST